MLKSRICSCFLTGLGVLLPLMVSLMVLAFLFRVVGGPLGYVFGRMQLPGPLATVAGFTTTVIIITVVGFVTRNVFGQQLVRVLESVFTGLPLLKSVYLPTRQLVEFLFSDKTEAFKRVALVEYPRKGVYTLGFVTGECSGEVQQRTEEELVSVFLPTTPNPTSGWLLLVPRQEVILLDMSVEEGLKLIVSGGVLTPQWQAEACAN